MREKPDIKRDEAALHALVSNVTLSAEDYRAISDARDDNAIRHVDHVGLACRDAAETRHFYEDILGMPLVNTIVLPDPFRPDGAKYCHFFFEMGNGNYIAFFDHLAAFVPEDFTPKSGFQLHFAFEVKKEEMVHEYRARLEAHGVGTQFVDHCLYRSLYFHDPNGVLLEITFKVEGTTEYEAKARTVAHSLLNKWIADRPALLSELNGKST